jgi:hypothetical protein
VPKHYHQGITSIKQSTGEDSDTTADYDGPEEGQQFKFIDFALEVER